MRASRVILIGIFLIFSNHIQFSNSTNQACSPPGSTCCGSDSMTTPYVKCGASLTSKYVGTSSGKTTTSVCGSVTAAGTASKFPDDTAADGNMYFCDMDGQCAPVAAPIISTQSKKTYNVGKQCAPATACKEASVCVTGNLNCPPQKIKTGQSCGTSTAGKKGACGTINGKKNVCDAKGNCVASGDGKTSFLSAGTKCGSVPTNECAEQPTCTGSSIDCPTTIKYKTGQPCGKKTVTSECKTTTYTCSSTGQCVGKDSFLTKSCGTPVKKTCGTISYTCSQGACTKKSTTYTPGVSCGKTTNICMNSPVCVDGKLDCPEPTPKNSGTICGSGKQAQSYPCGKVSGAAPTCDGNGKCISKAGQTTYSPTTTICSKSTNDCISDAYCTGKSLDCPAKLYKKVNSPCKPSRDLSAAKNGACFSISKETASCNGKGVCQITGGQKTLKSKGTVCNPGTTLADKKETVCSVTSKQTAACDEKGNCVPSIPVTTPKTGSCGDPQKYPCGTVSKVCKGTDCVSVTTYTPKVTCKTSTDPCVNPSVCEDNNLQCPQPTFKDEGTLCGTSTKPKTGACGTIPATADKCDANGKCVSTPAEPNYLPSGTICRKSTEECQLPGKCTGNSIDCPSEITFKNKGTSCGDPKKYQCGTVNKVCNEKGKCVEDIKYTPKVVCKTTSNACKNPAVCKEGSLDCPDTSNKTKGTTCGQETTSKSYDCGKVSGATPTCDGKGNCLPGIGIKTMKTDICKKTTSQCENDRVCDGKSLTCPGKSLKKVGTPCKPTNALAKSKKDLCGEVTADTAACDKNGNCVITPGTTKLKSKGTVCRKSTNECEVPATCDGKSITCPTKKSFVAAGKRCSGSSSSSSSSTDTDGSEGDNTKSKGETKAKTGLCGTIAESHYECNGSGQCKLVGGAISLKTKGTICRQSTNPCKEPDVCDGESVDCPSSSTNKEDGIECKDKSDSDGDSEKSGPCGQITQSGSTCQNGKCTKKTKTATYVKKGVVCRKTTNECEAHATCDGKSIDCPTTNPFKTKGTACGGTSGAPKEMPVCGASYKECDGNGKCVTINKLQSKGTSCGDSKVSKHPCGTTTGKATCDGEGKCIPLDSSSTLLPKGTVCNEAKGECELPSVCDGVSTSCPSSKSFKPKNTPCGTSNNKKGGACGTPKSECDGYGTCLDKEGFTPGKVCQKFPEGSCKVNSVCPEGSYDCPAPTTKPENTPCSLSGAKVESQSGPCGTIGADIGFCNKNGECVRKSGKQSIMPKGTICKQAEGECGMPAKCDGKSITCPDPISPYKPQGTTCRAASGTCDLSASCTGKSSVCPPNEHKKKGTICRASKGPCDVQEVCDGKSSECPSDGKKEKGVVCSNFDGECGSGGKCDGKKDTCSPVETRPVGTLCGGYKSKSSGTECGGMWKECNAKGQCVTVNSTSEFVGKACGGGGDSTSDSTSDSDEDHECGMFYKKCDSYGVCRQYGGYEKSGKLCGGYKKIPYGVCGSTWKQCDGKGHCIKKKDYVERGTPCDGGDKSLLGPCGGKYKECDGQGKCSEKDTTLEPGTSCGTTTKSDCQIITHICNERQQCVENVKLVDNFTPCNGSKARSSVENEVCGAEFSYCYAGTCIRESTLKPKYTPCSGSSEAPKNECGGSWLACNGRGKCEEYSNFAEKGSLCENSTRPDDFCGGEWKECDGLGQCVMKQNYKEPGTICLGELTDNECGGAWKVCDGLGQCIAKNTLKPKGTLCAGTVNTTAVCGGAWKECDGKGACTDKNTFAEPGTLCGEKSNILSCLSEWMQCDGKGGCLLVNKKKPAGVLCDGTIRPTGECGGDWKECDEVGQCIWKSNRREPGTVCGNKVKTDSDCGSLFSTCDANGMCKPQDTRKPAGTGCSQPIGQPDPTETPCGKRYYTCDGEGLCVMKINYKSNGTICSRTVPPQLTTEECAGELSVCDGQGSCNKVTQGKSAGALCGGTTEIPTGECGGVWNECTPDGKCATRSNVRLGIPCGGTNPPTGECGGSWKRCNEAGQCVAVSKVSEPGTMCNGSLGRPSNQCGGEWSECDGNGKCEKHSNKKVSGSVCGDSRIVDPEGCGSSWSECDEAGQCVARTLFSEPRTLCGNTTRPLNECGGSWKECDGLGHCMMLRNILKAGQPCKGSIRKSSSEAQCGYEWWSCDSDAKCVANNNFLPPGSLCGNMTRPSSDCGGTWMECDGKGGCISKTNQKEPGTRCDNLEEEFVVYSECGSNVKICNEDGKCVPKSTAKPKGTLCDGSIIPTDTCGGSWKECDGEGRCVDATNYKTKNFPCVPPSSSGSQEDSVCKKQAGSCNGKGTCEAISGLAPRGTACGGDPIKSECGIVQKTCDGMGSCVSAQTFLPRGTLCGSSTRKTGNECGESFMQCDGNGQCGSANNFVRSGTPCEVKKHFANATESDLLCYESFKTCDGKGQCSGSKSYRKAGTVCGRGNETECSTVMRLCDGEGICAVQLTIRPPQTPCGGLSFDKTNQCGGKWSECDENGKCVIRQNYKEKGTLCGSLQRKVLQGCSVFWEECNGNGECEPKRSLLEPGSTCNGTMKPLEDSSCGGFWKECDNAGRCVARTSLKERGTLCAGSKEVPELATSPCGGEWSECDGKGSCIRKNNFLKNATTCGRPDSDDSDGCMSIQMVCNGRGQCLTTRFVRPEGTSCGKETSEGKCGSVFSTCNGAGRCIKRVSHQTPGTSCGETIVGACMTTNYVCNGNSSCVREMTYKTKGVSCGTIQPQSNSCRNTRSQCDGHGLCVPIDEVAPYGTACGAELSDDGVAHQNECGGVRTICNGLGQCISKDDFENAGTPCGGRTSTAACGNSRSVCNGQGTCIPANSLAPEGTSCGPSSAKACSSEVSVCEGGGKCIKKEYFSEKGTICGASKTFACHSVSYLCNGNGSCSESINFLEPGTQCGESSTSSCGTTMQLCDGIGNCMKTNKFFGSETLCREAISVCDLPEFCNGTSLACPLDKILPAGTSCGEKSKSWCSKSENFCTVDGICQPKTITMEDGSICGEAGPCGSSACKNGECISRFLEPGTPCGGDSESSALSPLASSEKGNIIDGAGACIEKSFCTGNSTFCPSAFKPSGFLCRASRGDCDVPEYCTGKSPDCPIDNYHEPGTVCREKKGDCDVAEVCSGYSASCPSDNFLEPGTLCREKVGLCDSAEVCTGFSAACPSDTYLPQGTVCRKSIAKECDSDVVCDGTSSLCEEKVFIPMKDKCNGGFCISRGECQIYKIQRGPNDPECVTDAQCDDGNPCTVDTCNDAICIFTPGNKGTICKKARFSQCDLDLTCDGVASYCGSVKDTIIVAANVTDLWCGLNGMGKCKDVGLCEDVALSAEISNLLGLPQICESDANCDDGNPCSTDKCVDKICVHTPGGKGLICQRPLYSQCDSPAVCNGETTKCPASMYVPLGEQCEAAGATTGKCIGRGECTRIAPMSDKQATSLVRCTADSQCDDGNPCTVDLCLVDGAGVCTHYAGNQGAVCHNAKYEQCDADIVCSGESESCPNATFVTNFERCGPEQGMVCVAVGVCSYDPRISTEADGIPKPCFGDEHCDDGKPCTVDTCVNEVCVHTPGNKGFVCHAARNQECDVDDICDGVSDDCPLAEYTKVGTACGTNFTGLCTARGKCDTKIAVGTAFCYHDSQCDDSNPCTVDKCNLKTFSCVHTAGNKGVLCRAKDSKLPCSTNQLCDGVFSQCPEPIIDVACLKQHNVDYQNIDYSSKPSSSPSSSVPLTAADEVKKGATEEFPPEGLPELPEETPTEPQLITQEVKKPQVIETNTNTNTNPNANSNNGAEDTKNKSSTATSWSWSYILVIVGGSMMIVVIIIYSVRAIRRKMNREHEKEEKGAFAFESETKPSSASSAPSSGDKRRINKKKDDDDYEAI
eukprot:TRINITY_DN4_c0_g1_i1.p1 TRINITY_DN4_c0_g1~~TRINITY_DN4_c0_g1_i1.p1  ORF type:complete len:3898 (+),score=1114.73 TRINITY_DN4_c0_g1_i1:60-11696(+)